MITAERRRSSDDEHEFIYASGSIVGLEGRSMERPGPFVLLTYDADNT